LRTPSCHKVSNRTKSGKNSHPWKVVLTVKCTSGENQSKCKQQQKADIHVESQKNKNKTTNIVREPHYTLWWPYQISCTFGLQYPNFGPFKVVYVEKQIFRCFRWNVIVALDLAIIGSKHQDGNDFWFTNHSTAHPGLK